MYKFYYAFITSIVLSFSLSLQAEDHSDSENKRPVFEIGISMSIPPWVIKENDSGIELDILRESLGEDKYDIRPVYSPFERAYRLFESGQLDGVMNSKEGVAKQGYLSQPVVTFQNYAISLASKGFPKSIPMSFLYDKSVVGFQKSRQFLGSEYADMAQQNALYQEVPKQALQINLLFIRELDFIVMDKSIFGYYWYQASQNHRNNRVTRKRFDQKVTFHPLFKSSPYPFLFRDKAVRDDFDRGLAKLRASGRYQEIHESYSHLSDLYK